MVTTDDLQFMKVAIAKADEGIRRGQTPFGSCIVKGGNIVCAEHNVVWATTDITAHAEVNAIRKACSALSTIDLTGCTLYSSCEPCPMCFSAIHWANFDRVVFGARIADAQRAGFNELTISAEQMKSIGQSRVELTADVCRSEAAELFERWLARQDRRVY